MLKYDDDAQPHAKNDGKDWRESYYCNFFDRDSDLCGVFWQGARPNAQHAEAVFLLCDGPDDLIRSVDLKIPRPHDVPVERSRLGSSQFTCIKPWEHWQVRFARDSDYFELDWRQMSDVCDWEWEDLTNSKHLQVAGKVRGKGQVGGRRLEFTGYGERDRAWGERNYGPLKVSLWMVAQFPDDVAVHAFALLMPDGSYRLHGYLHQQGVTRGLTRFEAAVVYESDRGPPASGRLNFVDDLGRRLEIQSFQLKNQLALGAAPANGAQLELDASRSNSLMFLTFQRFARADGQVGHGMIDYNCWVGSQPKSIVAEAPPLYSTLYPYGRRDR